MHPTEALCLLLSDRAERTAFLEDRPAWMEAHEIDDEHGTLEAMDPEQLPEHARVPHVPSITWASSDGLHVFVF